MASKAARTNDYIYDPLYIVSGEKDYYKAAMVAKLSSAKFAICPIFPSMFSDLPHQPRQMVVMRKSAPIPTYVDKLSGNIPIECGHRPVDLAGADRSRFFHAPVIRPDLVKLPTLPISTTPRIRSKIEAPKKRNKKIQTKYRESSAQTHPWQPSDYIVVDEGDPELLMLDFLKWGSGLPAGMHEVRLIERARMKRAWEKALPPVVDAATLEIRRRVIEAIERDEWAFREQEIQDIHDLRLELLEKMLDELHQKTRLRTEQKMKNFCQIKAREKEEKLKRIRHDSKRALRKLEMMHRGVKRFYGPVDIIEEHADKKSELYGPLMRHGEHPKRWHLVIDEHLKKYRAQFLGVEEISTLPRWLDQATKMKDCVCVKLPGTRLCIRETKWTSPVLKQLHEELKNLRKDDKQRCTLMVKIQREVSGLLTPQVEDGDDWEEELHQAIVLMESVLRGRASQLLIYEGRDRCKELIQELRSTHGLQDEDRFKKFKQRFEVKSQQREHLMCTKNASKLRENLNKLSGNVVGTLLDFLNKELRRLLDERRIHAMCLLFERERHLREAAEAGRRQIEERRRLEHDEMFKQVVKVNQDTVDLYLEDIITEGMEFASKEEGHVFVEKMAKTIDDEAYATLNKSNYHEEEELIAKLVHNFLLPEVEKQIVRDKIKKKQHNYLKTAHEAIYQKMEHLPQPETKPFKMKYPPTNEEPSCSLQKSEHGGFDEFLQKAGGIDDKSSMKQTEPSINQSKVQGEVRSFGDKSSMQQPEQQIDDLNVIFTSPDSPEHSIMEMFKDDTN